MRGNKKIKIFIILFVLMFFVGVFIEITGVRIGAAYGAISLEELPAIIPNVLLSSLLISAFLTWFISLGNSEEASDDVE